MSLPSYYTILFLLSVSATLLFTGKCENADEYHARIEPLLEDAFNAQNETQAWWIGFSHPHHGDQYWTFGNSSDSNGIFPPDVPSMVDDHFYIGSISKSFGSIVNLKLIEEGKFALNDTVSSIVPDFATTFPEYANVTPAELMGMQTKVPDFLNNPQGFITELIKYPNARYSIQEIVEFAMKDYPVTPHGELYDWILEANMTLQDIGIDEYYEYSTTNILVMELIAESVTGKSMKELVSKITSELGLSNTALPLRDAAQGVLPDPVTHSYIGSKCVDEINGSGGNVSLHDRNDAFDDSIVNFGSGGSMYSTIVDLLAWAKSGLGDSLLEPETVKRRHEFKPTDFIMQYGLGIHKSDFVDSDGWYGHGGDAFGSTTRAYKNDDTGQSFASAVNTCNYSSLHAKGFEILVDNGQVGRLTPPTGTPSSAPSITKTPTQITNTTLSNTGNTVSTSLLLTILWGVHVLGNGV